MGKMKNVYALAMMLLLFCNVSVAQNAGKVKFAQHEINYKNIKVNKIPSPLIANFTFENVGNTPLVILNVETGCRCVQARWSKMPIRPHNKQTISIIFDHKRQKGFFDKKIVVRMNTNPSIQQLIIRGNIQ